MSLEATEKECAANAMAPRVSLADIGAAMHRRYYFTGADVVDRVIGDTHPALEVLTICLIVMRNGFTIIGKSAPASADNFNAELGKTLAYEDAIRQIWPLMGYALRDKLMEAK